MKIGLQLWSVFGDSQNDLLGTLEKVAAMGYDGVEFAGYFGHDAKTIKAKLDELGLDVASSHIGCEQLRDNLDDVIAFEKELGNQYIVCPYATFPTVAEWVAFAAELGSINEKVKAAGLTFVYHNHAEEFQEVDGKYVFDLILENVDKAEIDVYWAAFSIVDPIAYLQKYAGRTPLVHIKDMASCKTKSTEVGHGILDISNIAKQAIAGGAEWLIVEQEAFEELAPMDAVAVCLKNFKEVLAND